MQHKRIVNFKMYYNKCGKVMDTADVNYLQINTTLKMDLQQRAFPKDIKKTTY